MEFKCVLKSVLEILGEKWAIPIIYVLFGGTNRFKELERDIPNINTRMLTKTLKKLETTNMISIKAYAIVPPTVEYSLTDKGGKTHPIILDLYK